MTSRSEYRLLLRQDNADRRLTPFGYSFGSYRPRNCFNAFTAKYKAVDAEVERIKNTYLSPSEELDALLESRSSTPVRDGACLADLLRRPELDYEALAPVDSTRPELTREEKRGRRNQEIKYEGYSKRQMREPSVLQSLKTKSCRKMPIMPPFAVSAPRPSKSSKNSARKTSDRPLAFPASARQTFKCL